MSAVKKISEEQPKRKNNRLKEYDYSSEGTYFITICAKDRRNYFWNNVGTVIGRPQDVELSEYGRIVDKAINNIPTIYPSVLIDRYVVMPDHIHLMLFICDDENGRPMVVPTVLRVIRNRKDYGEYINYIYENPMRWS